jgi:hypothetical protein
VGSDTVTALRGLRADVAFLGANGITPGFGFSTPDQAEAQTKYAMTEAARRRIALVDEAKLGEELLWSFGTTADIDVLITDAPLRPPRHHRPPTRRNGRDPHVIITVTPNPSIDRTQRLPGPLDVGGVNRVVSGTDQAGGKGVNVATVVHHAGDEVLAVVPADAGTATSPSWSGRSDMSPSVSSGAAVSG